MRCSWVLKRLEKFLGTQNSAHIHRAMSSQKGPEGAPPSHFGMTLRPTQLEGEGKPIKYLSVESVPHFAHFQNVQKQLTKA